MKSLFYISAAERKKIPDADFAGPGRTFPIRNQSDLDSAAHLVGRAKDPEAVKRKIIRIAKRKGLTLPQDWQKEQDDKKAAMSKLLATFAKGNMPEMSANQKRDLLSTQLCDAFEYQYWLTDVYDAYIIACEYEMGGCEYTRIPYTIEADFSVTWGNPQAVVAETLYHPVPDTDDDEETANMSTFSGGINGVGFKKSNVLVDGFYVYDSSTLFEVGDYPDKNFRLTWEEADAAISKFEPCPLNLEHAPELLKGKVGTLEDIWLDGDTIKGRVKIPQWLDDQFTDDDRKLSAEWTLDDKSLVGLAITATPRVESAALISAYSAFTHSTDKSQASVVAVPAQEGGTGLSPVGKTVPKKETARMSFWDKLKALFTEAGIKIDDANIQTTETTAQVEATFAEDKEKVELAAFKAQVLTNARTEAKKSIVAAFGQNTDKTNGFLTAIDAANDLASISLVKETADEMIASIAPAGRASKTTGQEQSISAAFNEGSAIASLPDVTKADFVAAFSSIAEQSPRAKAMLAKLKEKGVLN